MMNIARSVIVSLGVMVTIGFDLRRRSVSVVLNRSFDGFYIVLCIRYLDRLLSLHSVYFR